MNTVKVQTAFYWFSRCFAYIERGVLWGIVVRGLHVKTFVRVLRSSGVNLNNVNNTNVFCCV